MDNDLLPRPSDPAHQLQREVYYEAVNTLHLTLPPRPNNTAEDDARRFRVAIAQVAAMIPANADEAHLAARSVAAGAHVDDCLRCVVQHADDPAAADQLRAQTARSGRESRGFRSLLLRVQAARLKREANPAATDSAAWTEHSVQGLMANALSVIAPAPAAPAPAAEQPPPAPPEAAWTPSPQAVPAQPPQPPTPPQAAPPQPHPAAVPPRPHPAPVLVEPPEPPSGPDAEADTYAILHPQRARLIRQCGGLPAGSEFGPPEPALLRAIVTGTSAVLRSLDGPRAAAA
jgi:hypothetical protein